jgi:beta-glucosidase
MFSRKTTYLIIALSIFGYSKSFSQVKSTAPYRKNPEEIEKKIDSLLQNMTLEEKLEQLSGMESGFDTKENLRLKIPALHMTDGPVGVRTGKATAFPSGVALASSWDTTLLNQVGVALGEEANAKGLNYLLGPCINIHRFPLGGRNFESYGEDPYLASRLAVAYIRGVQSQNVLASVKHFACNNQEWERNHVDVKISDRALNEIFLPAFKAAVQEAGVWTVMCAYNKVNGHYCSENETLLTDILKKEWGFTGFVVSDWGATHSTIGAANAGLDLEMPNGTYFGNELLKAVKEKKVGMDVIDDKVRRVIRVKFEAGLFDKNDVSPITSAVNSKEHQQLALNAAEKGIILLKNQGNLLPLDQNKITSIAIIGPNATIARTGGGGSSHVDPFYAVSPLEGIRNLLPKDFIINYAQGEKLGDFITPIDSDYFSVNYGNTISKGLLGEYFDNPNLEGKPVFTKIDKNIDFEFGEGSPTSQMKKDSFSIRWTGKLTSPSTNTYTLTTLSDDGIRVYLDNKLIINDWSNHPPITNSADVQLKANHPYDIKIEYYENVGGASVHLGWEIPLKVKNERIDNAVNVAKKSDVAILFTGYSDEYETEGEDRKGGFHLPGTQDELISAVVKANPRTIIVLNSGTPVSIDKWINEVPSFLLTAYPGEEGSNAIANILFGTVNPSGKLPYSFIASEKQTPAFNGYKDKNLEAHYDEGIFIGYRYLDKNKLLPSFSFGYGLSYTTFSYQNLLVKELPGQQFLVSLEIINTGKIKGDEIAQVYVKEYSSLVERPEKELKGFKRVSLSPGEKQTIEMKSDKKAFSYYNEQTKQWATDPGKFEIMVGSSSADIKLKKDIMLKH